MKRNIIDLSLTVEEGMITFPVMWHPYVEITQLGRMSVEQRETRKIVMGTHTGTHIDAPRHFIAGGETAENIPLDLLVGPALLLDFSDLEPGHEIAVRELNDKLDGRTPERIIMRFDWSDRLYETDYYTRHPFLSEESAHFLVENGVKLLAMDSPMPDNPKNGRGTPNDSPVHKILLGNDVVIVEYLTNLRSIGNEEVELVVAPLKIRESDGAPARCFVIEKR